MEDAQRGINVKFVFNYCNDIAVMKQFYTDLVGLHETSYNNDEEWQWLTYKCDGFEFMFFQAAGLEVPTEFSDQPGWQGGTLPRVSWAIEVPDAEFASLVQRMKNASVRSFADIPQWCHDSYWSFPVLDPMGNTVELYCKAKERPASTEWGTQG